jgi:hypothetical protein
VKVACALAIALGTYLGGWRIIRTLGKGLVEIAPPQGLAAESASAAVILASSQLGFALSTTHVATGSILGTGVGRPGAQVRWRVAGRMVAAWLITLPAAAEVHEGGVTGPSPHRIGTVVGWLLLPDRACRGRPGHHVHRGRRLRQGAQLRAHLPDDREQVIFRSLILTVRRRHCLTTAPTF